MAKIGNLGSLGRKKTRLQPLWLIFLLSSMLLLTPFIFGNSGEANLDGDLKRILKSEVIDVEDWNCLDYALYYNETLSQKYPELDIRFPRYVDICNKLKLCENYHTFLVIGGYGSECILDQRTVICNQLIYKAG